VKPDPHNPITFVEASIKMGPLNSLSSLKVLLSFIVNGVAALCFLAFGKALIPLAILMAVGATLGGWLGARLAQRLPPGGMRGVAIAVGLYAAVRMLLR